MFLERPEVSDLMKRFGTHACLELFGAYGVKLLHGADDRELSGPVFSSVIGLVGDKLRATCLLAATEGPLRASCPAGEQLRDWTGELANQLVGRIKMQLFARSVNVALSTPLTLTSVRLVPLPRSNVGPIQFTLETEPVTVWLEVQATSDFELGPECLPVVSTGELRFF
jgi:hypothetical protein